ncbi:MAG: YdcF family protein [Isosphaeraceae bacterium]|nr:YdcF family protein [Isosphaeraceae bacterium]
MYFILTKIFLQPFPLLLLIAGVVIANLWRRGLESKWRLGLLTFAFGALSFFCVPAVTFLELKPLEAPFPPLQRRPTDAGAIVVLAGGIARADSVRPRPELTEDTLYRCLCAAELYHAGSPCPVIVTGGKLDPNSLEPPVAPYMRELLVRLGVRPDDVISEDQARTTRESAREVKRLLDGLGVRKAVLVTEAYHMPRSVATFRKQGLDVVPGACHHLATEFRWKLESFVPTPGAARDGMHALHEWLGLAWYRLRGWI